MITTRSFKHLVWGALVLSASQAQGQATILGHSGGTGDHLGWNALTPQALEVRHDGNWPIQWYTDAIQRMMLNPTVSTGINGFAAAPRNGFLLLSGQPAAFASSAAPFTRLHLVDDVGSASAINYAQEIGYRPWQRNGITFTGNSDQSYIGHKYGGTDNTDFVIQWSDNPNGSPWGVDRMKFVLPPSTMLGHPKEPLQAMA